MNCVECFKNKSWAEADYIHFGKSLCANHVDKSIEDAKAVATAMEQLQTLLQETSEMSRDVSKRMDKFLKSVELPEPSGQA